MVTATVTASTANDPGTGHTTHRVARQRRSGRGNATVSGCLDASFMRTLPCHRGTSRERRTGPGNLRSRWLRRAATPPAEFLSESVQPYQRVDDPTAPPARDFLNRVWNVDKHRTLNVVGVNDSDPEKASSASTT